MVGSSEVSGGTERDNALALLVLLCAATAIALRIVVTPDVLNIFVDYTSEGGFFLTKLHPATYVIVLLIPVVLMLRPMRLWGDDVAKFRALFRFSGILIALTAYLIVSGRAGGSGFLLDTYLPACAAGMLVLAVGGESRRLIGEMVLWLLALSALMGIAEAILEVHLLPTDLNEASFRPLGLTNHPLALGALCATAIGFVAATRWRLWLRAVVIVLLYMGCAAAGARFALLIASVEILVLLLFVPWGRLSKSAERRAKLAAFVITLLAGAVLIVILSSAGFLSRFQDALFDDSAMARVTIYRIFEFVSLQQILFGMDTSELIDIVNKELELPFIESAPVILIMTVGAFGAVLFVISLVLLLRRLLRGAAVPALIATVCYFVVSLSNNALATKTPEVMVVFVLLLALAPRSAAVDRSPTHDHILTPLTRSGTRAA